MFTGNFNQSSEITQTMNKGIPLQGFDSNSSTKGEKLNWKSLNLIESLPHRGIIIEDLNLLENSRNFNRSTNK